MTLSSMYFSSMPNHHSALNQLRVTSYIYNVLKQINVSNLLRFVFFIYIILVSQIY